MLARPEWSATGMSRLLRSLISLAFSVATLILLIQHGAFIYIVPYLLWHAALSLYQLILLLGLVKRRPDLFNGDPSTVLRRARDAANEINKIDQ
jgi:hypothetical protein